MQYDVTNCNTLSFRHATYRLYAVRRLTTARTRCLEFLESIPVLCEYELSTDLLSLPFSLLVIAMIRTRLPEKH
jgi:hypothetical protein